MNFLTHRVTTENHLAVLLPRSVTIYALAVREGAVDHGNQCIMNKIYEHKLERTAANMTHGPFGGVKGCLKFSVILIL